MAMLSDVCVLSRICSHVSWISWSMLSGEMRIGGVVCSPDIGIVRWGPVSELCQFKNGIVA